MKSRKQRTKLSGFLELKASLSTTKMDPREEDFELHHIGVDPETLDIPTTEPTINLETALIAAAANATNPDTLDCHPSPGHDVNCRSPGPGSSTTSSRPSSMASEIPPERQPQFEADKKAIYRLFYFLPKKWQQNALYIVYVFPPQAPFVSTVGITA